MKCLPMVTAFLIASLLIGSCRKKSSVMPSSDSKNTSKVNSISQAACVGEGSNTSVTKTSYINWERKRDVVDLNALKAAIKFRAVDENTILSDFDRKNPSHRHPRLMADATDFERLKKLAKSNDAYYSKALKGVLRRAEIFLGTPLPQYDDTSQVRLQTAIRLSEQLITLAFAYRMTEDTRFSDKVRDHLLNYAGFKKWSSGNFLDTGIITGSVALAFDWIYETFDVAQKNMIVTAALEKGIKAGINTIGYSPAWYQGDFNWNPVCNGGLSMVALAILDENNETRKLGATVIAKALTGVTSYIRAFEPDGQSIEGIHYWEFGVTGLIRMLESARTALGSDYDLGNTAGLAQAAIFPVKLSGPVIGISIGDDPLKKQRSDSNFWFAKRYQIGFVADYHFNESIRVGNFTATSVEDMIFYDPTLISNCNLAMPPLDNYLRGLDYVSFRSSWDNPTAIFTGIHAGTNRGPHNHLGAGSFDIQAYGKVFAFGGLGNDDYTYPGYFTVPTQPGYTDSVTEQKVPSRFHIYRLRAEGKNEVVLNPDIRPEQDPGCSAAFDWITTNADEAKAQADLTSCYNRDASKYQRTLALTNHRSEIALQDRITTKTTSTAYWFMHTPAIITLDPTGRKATLTIDDKSMIVKLREPAGATFSTMDATNLPDEKFPLSRNSPNTFQGNPIRKLVIKVSDFSDGLIDIRFTFAK